MLIFSQNYIQNGWDPKDISSTEQKPVQSSEVLTHFSHTNYVPYFETYTLMNDLAYLESKQCLLATIRGSYFTLGFLPSLLSVSFLIFSSIFLSEHYFDKGLSNTQKAEKKY